MSGWANASGARSYAHFSGAGTTLPFQDGIMLTTGVAQSGIGPNTLLLGEGPGSWEGDSDLENALGMTNTYNATVLEFDFVPLSNTINFNYIFASEEYVQNLQLNACDYTDGFGFLLKEAGTTTPYQNLAVLPDTNIPVMITTVRGEGTCPSANEEYFDAYNGEGHPTNYNGQTVVLTAHSEVTPGVTYHIKLVIADQGDTLFDSAIFLQGGSFTTVAYLGQDRLLANGNPLCPGETLTVNAASNGATGYQWYKDNVALSGETNGSYVITSAGVYTVDVQFGSCTAEGKITAEYTPDFPTTATILQCDDDGDGLTVYTFQNIAETVTADNTGIAVTGYYLTQTAADNGAPKINTASGLFTNTQVNQQLYVSVVNPYGCSGIVPVTLSTPTTVISMLSPIITCDTDGEDDGLFDFNLTQIQADIQAGLPAGMPVAFYTSYHDALVENEPASLQFTNSIPGGQSLYVRASNGADCFGIAEIPLVVHYFGNLQDEDVYLCDGNSLLLQAPDGMAAYQWQTAEIQTAQTLTITQPGEYTVKVVNALGCEGSKTFHAQPSGAAQGAEYEINDFAGAKNTLLVKPKGAGQYEFSLDGVRYQSNPLFENVAAGEYMLHIRDSNGCGPEFRDKVTILDYMRYFTPNGDGINDIWQVENLKSRRGLVVRVYDRFGKPLISIRGEAGWDGTLKGRPLPSNDYWFAVTLENGRVVKGHFSLIR